MSGDTDANHRNPLSSSSSTPSGTSALSVTIEAEPGPAVAAEPELAPVENTEILQAEPTEAIAAGEAEAEGIPPEPVDDDAPLKGEPAEPVVAAEDQPVEAVSPEPVAEIVEDAVAEPIAAFAEETIVEPVAAVAAEAIVPEPVAALLQEPQAAAQIDAEPVLEAALPDEPQIVQDNIPDAVSEALPDEPAAVQAEPEIARLVPVASEPDPRLTQKLRAAVRETLAQNEAKQDRVFHVFGQASAKLKDALDEAGQDAARITFKLMEFAQANVRNNLEFARNYASVRSVPDMFDLQAAYFTRQMALMNAQAEEFRKLTAELTAKAAAPVKSEIKVLTTSR